MLNKLKQLFDKEEILAGGFGIERESLRVGEQGKLAITDHPEVFGHKLLNPYITTDFSESQVELITPAFKSPKETYNFANALYDIVALKIENEYLWPQSMPCDLPEDKDIPIAKYSDCKPCKEARSYREELFKKYGGKRQLISGIHYNFSFDEAMIQKLYENSAKDMPYKDYKSSLYLKIIRNYARYKWLLIYLIGATPVAHESYLVTNKNDMDLIGQDAYSNKGAISYRNGKMGYRNEVELFPDYSSVANYIQSVEDYIEAGVIQSYKEVYNSIRPKAKNNHELFESLKADGVQYIEIRSIDINPFEKGGVSLEDLEFLQLFMLYLLVAGEATCQTREMVQREGSENQMRIAQHGLEDISLVNCGKSVKKTDWALDILTQMKEMDQTLGLEKAAIIDRMIQKVVDPKLTYAYRITELCKKEGYLDAHLKLAKYYFEDAYKNRYKLYGYEDMELSTQILMKEAIKRGIDVEILDQADNFIALKKDHHIEYVKQATKTSKDSYITMLVMENKTVTKKILEKHQICVPKGIEVIKGQNEVYAAKKYENKPIVVKPKSTNFGMGISIFTEGACKADILAALEIGFEHDTTVLIEEFVRGKEYRFLVVGDEVAGILHRVPANVVGDGTKSIRELVEIKNQDSLRGKGYKTPLEQIKLDESSKLFLKQSGLDFEYVPELGETVYLRENSNISTGGDSIDYTDDIPERFKKIAVAAAKAVEAKICGVDMMLEDYTDEASSYAIIELNFNPAIHIHSFPYKGVERNIADKVLRILGFDEALLNNCD